MQRLIQIIIIASSLALTACTLPYRIPVQQGNVITQEMLNRIKPGMSTARVRDVMGNPVLINTFNSRVLNYVYMLRPSEGATSIQRAVLHFSNNRLTHITH
jgi:outer membrane protein assembly factor BamE